MLTWIVFGILCLGLAGWLALDWWMGWTAPELDAAVKEFEEGWRRGVRPDWAVYGPVLAAMVYALGFLLLRSG
jgi:hypothetical protein